MNERVTLLWEDLDFGGEGNKPERSPKDMFKVLMLDLYVAKKTEPELFSKQISLGSASHISRGSTGQRALRCAFAYMHRSYRYSF